MILRILSLILFSFVLVSCSEPESDVPKNGIYFIVDGMGVASITGARLWKDGARAELALETVPVIGLAKTY